MNSVRDIYLVSGMKYLILIMMSLSMQSVMGQQSFPLYSATIPGSKSAPNEEQTDVQNGITRVSKISVPAISIFLPPKEKANGTAVIIFPGGGYWINAISHEGFDVAKQFNDWGITAFVVKYRIPNDATMSNRETGPLQDAQQAIHVVRSHAKEWGIDPQRIGILGFSAGGHLASTAGTHFNKPTLPEFKTANVRPDFMILIYPVISFNETITHSSSREQIIGKTPTPEKVAEYSNELQVTKDTPPAFLVHASDDGAVKVDNSILFYQALIKNNIPAELHIYQKGGHGFGMNNPTTSDKWMDRCKNWLKVNGWL